jgi:intracellular septation protein
MAVNDKITSSAAAPEAAKKLPFWIDFGPLLLFFVTFLYWKRDNPDDAMIWAAGVLAVAATLALIYAWVKYKHTSPILIFSTVVIGAFALAAFLFDDKRFIYMKPTVMNVIFGLAVIGGVFFKKNVIKLMMGSAFELPDAKWNVFAIRWGLFFFAMAILNEIIWRNFSETFWASFKVFGFLPLTVLFTASQIPFLTKHGKLKEP